MKIISKILDLYCGAGGAATGLHLAAPDAQIFGVDIRPQPHYPFTFVQGDALNPPFDLRDFDFIWASPPCQAHSVLKSMPFAKKHVSLVAATRELLVSAGTPYVIENVMGSPLQNPMKLCGSAFGLNVRRHRLFESSMLLLSNGCYHHLQPEPVEVAGGLNKYKNAKHRKPGSLEAASQAMGISWMNRKEIVQAVPPAYSRYILEQILSAAP